MLHVVVKQYLYRELLSFNSVSRPFKIISAHMRRTNQAKTGEPRENPPGTPARRVWLVSHLASAGLELTPDTTVEKTWNYIGL